MLTYMRMFTFTAILLGAVSCGKSEWVKFGDTKKDFITSIAEEGDVVWYGTRNGFVKFEKADEKRTLYTVNDGLSDNDVKFVTVDKSGRKWVGTNFGLSTYDGTNWDAYDASSSKIPANLILSVAFEGPVVWVATGGGIGRLEGTEWSAYTQTNSGLLDNYTQSIAVDDKGLKWIGAQDGGLFRLEGTKAWIEFDSSSASPIKNPVSNVKQVAIDKTGVKWMATSRGLLKFDDKQFTLYNTSNSRIPDNLVRALAIDGAGNKWLATNKGLARFDGTNWSVFNTGNSEIPADRVTAVAVGRDDHIWVGCENQGLVVFKAGGVTLVEGQ